MIFNTLKALALVVILSAANTITLKADIKADIEEASSAHEALAENAEQKETIKASNVLQDREEMEEEEKISSPDPDLNFSLEDDDEDEEEFD